MNAATTRRPCLPAWARTLRMKGTRHDDSARADAPAGADLHIGRIEPEIGPVALQRPIEKGGDLAVDLAAQPADLAFRDARHAHGFDQIIDRARRHAVHVSLLDNRGEGFLGQAPRFQKHREVAALAQLWDAQLDRPGAGLPDPVSVAIAVIDAVRAALAVRGTGQPPGQARGSIRRCAAKPTISRSKSASELFSSSVRRLIISSVIVGSSVSVEGLGTKPYRRSAMTTAMDKWPAAARLVAVAAAGHLPTAPTPPQGTRPEIFC